MIPDGDRLILKLPGGAGMGDPTARDPVLVARDVRDGLVSAENARSLYKVAINGEGTVDDAVHAVTAQLTRFPAHRRSHDAIA